MSRNVTMLQILAACLIGILPLSFYIKSSRSMPENAVVFIDDYTKTYLAPPCVKNRSGLRVGRATEARGLGYKPNSECRDEGWFIQDGRSLIGLLFEKIGILQPLPSRWNEDGTWNY